MKKDKELFIKICSTLETQNKIDTEFGEALDKINLLESDFLYNNYSLSKLLIEIANSLLPDPSSDWTGWFLYENDFGEAALTVEDQDGEIKIHSAGQLFDWLWKDNVE